MFSAFVCSKFSRMCCARVVVSASESFCLSSRSAKPPTFDSLPVSIIHDTIAAPLRSVLAVLFSAKWIEQYYRRCVEGKGINVSPWQPEGAREQTRLAELTVPTHQSFGVCRMFCGRTKEGGEQGEQGGWGSNAAALACQESIRPRKGELNPSVQNCARQRQCLRGGQEGDQRHTHQYMRRGGCRAGPKLTRIREAHTLRLYHPKSAAFSRFACPVLSIVVRGRSRKGP